MSDRKPLTWAERVYREGYAQGERLGYSSGLAEGMIESISEGLAKRLGEVLQEVMAESLLHCLEKGRTAGLRQALLEVTRLRFGEESEEAFNELTESIESPNALEKMLESAMWSKDTEDWIERATSLIDKEHAKEEAARNSAPISSGLLSSTTAMSEGRRVWLVGLLVAECPSGGDEVTVNARKPEGQRHATRQCPSHLRRPGRHKHPATPLLLGP